MIFKQKKDKIKVQKEINLFNKRKNIQKQKKKYELKL
ncbi:unnamed protein product [Paramecium sonneborni]|uniref:Uncharacterized protein n=1 Tax=Paramecium sonneborni TaxID=65129 RepID=A0A8S1KNQ0_9CILI|nr:unnamed protein product [Paramecium sonneborni]